MCLPPPQRTQQKQLNRTHPDHRFLGFVTPKEKLIKADKLTFQLQYIDSGWVLIDTLTDNRPLYL